MKKSKTIKAKPLLTKTERATIRAARRILRKLESKWEALKEDAWAGGSDETKALEDFLDALDKEHIDTDSIGCFIVLDNDK